MVERSIALPKKAEDWRAHTSATTFDEVANVEVASKATLLSIRLVSLLSLIGLMCAEVIAVFVDPGWGALCHGILAGAVIALASSASYRGSAQTQLLGGSSMLEAKLLVALALPPLLRLVTLAMPRDQFSRPASDGAVTLCLLGATLAAMRANGYGWREAGLLVRSFWPRMRLDLLVAGTGIIIGFVEFRILQPEGLIDELALNQVVIATLVVIAVAGIVEELMLRGVIQVASTTFFGSAGGIAFVAAIFAIMHFGYRSWQEVGLAFAIAVWLGLAVRFTGSLVGASMAHGLANVCLFVAFPLLLQ